MISKNIDNQDQTSLYAELLISGEFLKKGELDSIVGSCPHKMVEKGGNIGRTLLIAKEGEARWATPEVVSDDGRVEIEKLFQIFESRIQEISKYCKDKNYEVQVSLVIFPFGEDFPSIFLPEDLVGRITALNASFYVDVIGFSNRNEE